MSDLFGYVRNIINHGVYDDTLADYNPYVLNIAVSMHLELVFYANEMNMSHAKLSERMHYDYLFYSIKKTKRYAKWIKGDKAATEDIGAVMEYFQYNRQKAKQVVGLLTTEELAEIKTLLTKGDT